MVYKMEFKAFNKIKQLKDLNMLITQKIHGSNAQIVVYCNNEGVTQVQAGSRNRWIYPHDDNFGFARFVEDNKQEIIEKLGMGIHYGEWAGPGINSGEGLKEKTLILFDTERYDPTSLPNRIVLVPVLYQGMVNIGSIKTFMDELKENGSRLVPGFMRPEGVVVTVAGQRFKKVFQAEETQWTNPEKSNKGQNKKEHVDYTYLCQPIRLEKLLSKDESYAKNYPQSLGLIVKDYIQDLVDEEQITGDEDLVKSIRKAATGQIFSFIRSIMDESDGFNY